jgi:urease accessory protein
MTVAADLRLVRLLQLASPTLPVGAYSYSQGLEAALEAGVVRDAETATRWIGEVLEYSVARTEAPIVLRLAAAWRNEDVAVVRYWNAMFLASRETSELRAETVQMGYSLGRLLTEIGEGRGLEKVEEIAFPTAFAYAVVRWDIDPTSALLAYLWAWLENQAMAAVKAVPLGQTDGQRMLLGLGERLEKVVTCATRVADDDIGTFAPRFALLSTRHEVQYSRLFRS